MKTILMFLLCLVPASLLLAQKKKDWKEMQAFHEVMAKTFHPAENGNLQPTKDNAGLLVAKAKAWKASKVPAGYNAKAVKPILDKLVAKCTAIQEGIAQNKSDDELKAMISEAHDTFHEIMEKCEK